jgi:hypothetical protein
MRKYNATKEAIAMKEVDATFDDLDIEDGETKDENAAAEDTKFVQLKIRGLLEMEERQSWRRFRECQ